MWFVTFMSNNVIDQELHPTFQTQRTLLYLAVNNKDKDMVYLLLKSGADANVKDQVSRYVITFTVIKVCRQSRKTFLFLFFFFY